MEINKHVPTTSGNVAIPVAAMVAGPPWPWMHSALDTLSYSGVIYVIDKTTFAGFYNSFVNGPYRTCTLKVPQSAHALTCATAPFSRERSRMITMALICSSRSHSQKALQPTLLGMIIALQCRSQYTSRPCAVTLRSPRGVDTILDSHHNTAPPCTPRLIRRATIGLRPINYYEGRCGGWRSRSNYLVIPQRCA